MTPQRPSLPTPRRARRALAASGVAVLLLVAAACGDDDDTATTASTTTTEAVDETTTTTSDEDEADDSDDDDQDDEAEADLLALLPDVSTIDGSYTEVPDDGDDDASGSDEVEDAMTEACPEAAAMFDEDDDDDSVEREYDGTLERSVTVGLDPTPRNLDEGTIDDAIAAVASCETVTLSQDGLDMTIDLTATRDDTYGDRGLLLTMNLSITSAQLPTPITLEMRGRIFQVGSLGASVNVTSGFDETTLEPVAGDFHLLDALAPELESAAAAHGG